MIKYVKTFYTNEIEKGKKIILKKMLTEKNQKGYEETFVPILLVSISNANCVSLFQI